jgi:hypothetical protein
VSPTPEFSRLSSIGAMSSGSKGLRHSADPQRHCKIAVEHGVDCVYVSNHGRQLDQGVGSIDVVPEVVEAVGGKARISSMAASAAALTWSRH